MSDDTATTPGSTLLALAGLGAAILVLYRPVFDGYLWHDDFAWLAGGQRLHLFSAFRISGRDHFYRPLIDVYFGLAMWLFGYSPRLFHALNVGLHLLNAYLVSAIARRVLGAWSQATAAALVFAVLPAILSAVAWVSAVTALLMTTCYLTAVLAHLKWLDTGTRGARWMSVVAFVGALLAHEAAVTLLPMMLLADTLLTRTPGSARRLAAWSYLPMALALSVYLAIAFQINRSNYLVTEGHYRPGLHVIGNYLQYITSLYLGQRGLWWYTITAIAVLAILRFGSRPARFGAAWMLVALFPYAFFEWGNTGRYMYLPAVGFSLMTAALLWSLARLMRSRLGIARVSVWAWIFFALVAGRFAAFTWRGTPGSTTLGEPYRMWTTSFKKAHGSLPRRTVIEIDEPVDSRIDPRSIQPMLQLEYNEPDLEVRIRNIR